jgi:cell wall-associated NlpC family hydrolase
MDVATEIGAALAQYAETFTGKIPYVLGGKGLNLDAVSSGATNFVADCASFVQAIYAKAGISLPANAASQYQQTKGNTVTTTLDTSKLLPGDLLFFGGWNEPSNPPGYGGVQHVGIYAGNGMVVDEGGANPGNVGVTSLSSYGTGHFIAATRVTGSSTMLSNPLFTPSTGWPGAVIASVQTGIGAVANGVTGAALDIAAFAGVAALALVLIIGGVVLLRPQSA